MLITLLVHALAGGLPVRLAALHADLAAVAGAGAGRVLVCAGCHGGPGPAAGRAGLAARGWSSALGRRGLEPADGQGAPGHCCRLVVRSISILGAAAIAPAGGRRLWCVACAASAQAQWHGLRVALAARAGAR
jgi:hypothetical protein